MAHKKTFFISTAIPYVNAEAHIGFAGELIVADAIARFNRLNDRQVYFLNGTDENSLKNVLPAEAEGKKIEDFVKEKAGTFIDLNKTLFISNDDFIRTSTDKRHIEGAKKLWLACKKDDIYKKKYKGLYCVGCEEFKTEKDLVNGECVEHGGKVLEEVEEENYFFKLSNYGEQLIKLIENDTLKIIPESRKNETLAFIKSGLEDFSISRSKERAKNWGIEVPHDKTQIMYVWFDALSNYTNALGYAEGNEKYEKFWEKGDERLHYIGKGINRFHTIYWPAMLLSAGLQLPTKVVIHGYFTLNGKKISKSLGDTIDPLVLVNEYGADALRYYCLRESATFEDSDFTTTKFKETYNANLANGLGNLVSRILKMSSENLEHAPELPEDTIPEEFKELMEKYEIQKAADYIWQKIAELDLLIQEEQPFKVIKEHKETGQMMIRHLVLELNNIAYLLKPFLPETSDKIKSLITENKMPEAPLFPRKD